MSLSVFPISSTSSSSVNATGVIISSPVTLYKLTKTFQVGVYTITCVSSTVASVTFNDSNGVPITTAKTVNGTISVNLATQAETCWITTDTGSNVVITFTLTAAFVSAGTISFSGVLDTITTTSTYTPATTGSSFILVFGAGGGGGGSGGSASGGGGGGAGGLWAGFYTLSANQSVTIGAGGNGGTGATNANAGNAGGTTIFGNVQATGGNGGGGGSAGAGGTTGIGSGTGSGSNINILGTNSALYSGANGTTNAGSASTPAVLNSPRTDVKTGSTGGGGGGAGSGAATAGVGSGIGTGGNGSTNNTNTGGSASGRAAGGGGAGGVATGGSGSAGVVYVMRSLVIS